MAASTLASPNFPKFTGKSYETALTQSIEALLSSLRDPNPLHSTNFASQFKKFVHFKANPPLESIWVYAASVFTPTRSQITVPLTQLSAIKDLFQLVVSCSASCNSIKCIALVAPIIYNLHKFIVDLKGFQLGPKKERKISGEIRNLIDCILGYINVCCNDFNQNFDELEGLICPLGDLVSFWVNNGVQRMDVESLSVFFPLMSDAIVKRVSIEGCEMIELAGFVIAEAFLLKLCWKIRDEGFREKVQNEIKYWVICSVTALGSSYFYVTLLSMLLEPVLPITSIVTLEHVPGLRNILFDALISVEYSFLSPESFGKLPAKHAKCVIIVKLMACHEATNLFSKHGDLTKAAHYLDAFANSSLPSLITKSIGNDLGSELSTSEPMGSSPRAFLRWLLNIESRGIKIFDDDMSKYLSALDSKGASEQLEDMEDGKKPDSDLLFYIDNEGQEDDNGEEDEKMSERINAAFTAAAQSMQSSERGDRKRKKKDGDKREKVTFVKYNGFDHSALPEERSVSPRNDNSDSWSD